VSLFRRRGPKPTPLPDAARDVLGVTGHDRVLAWSALVGGGWAVATPASLRAVLPTGHLVNRPWTDVDHVAWDADSRMLAVWWVGSRQASPLEVEEGSFLPEVVHERVRASMVLSQDVDVPGGGTVRVALRRADDGTLSTQAVPGRGVRMKDPAIAALVERARARLRDEAGLPPGV
jgi:hypothetical protein